MTPPRTPPPTGRTLGLGRRRDAPHRPPTAPIPTPPDREHPRIAWWLDGPGQPAVQPAVDLVMLVLAVVLTVRWPGEHVTGRPVLPLLLLPLLVMLAMVARGVYRERLRASVLDGIGRVLGAVSIATMVIVVAELYVFDETLEVGVLVHAWALAVLCVGAGRVGVVLLQRHGRRRWGYGHPTLVVGAGSIGQRVARRLRQLPEYGLRPVGFLDANPRRWEGPGRAAIPVLGTPDELEAVAARTRAQHVVLAFSSDSDRSYVDLVKRCENAGLSVTLVPRLFDAMNDRATYETLGGLPLLALRSTDVRGWQFAVKHALDRTLASLMLLLCGPLLLTLALAVRLSSPGPVLFRQRRVGRDGRAFDLLKFRSMTMPPERPSFRPEGGHAPGGVEGDDRRTLIGRLMRRTSLDELPQLLNVVRGDMSLVGPRPERPEYVELFVRDIDRYDERHRVRAGITGWAQIHGLRGQTSLADRVEWDNWYIEHWSLGLDLKILLRTVTAVFHAAE